jgi:hypothetical protein
MSTVSNNVCVLAGVLSLSLIGSMAEAGERLSRTQKAMECGQGQEEWLNRWPLRPQDYGTCQKEVRKDASSGADLYVQPEANDEPWLNLWPLFSFSPDQREAGQEFIPAPEKLEDLDPHRKTPDLRMWPLWPNPFWRKSVNG